MKGMSIAGIVLLILGGIVLVRGASFSSKHEVLRVGDLKVTASEQQSIPPWVGVVAMVAGVGLLVGGSRKRA